MSDPITVEFADAASGIRGWAGSGIPGLAADEVAVLLFEGADVVAAERSAEASLGSNRTGALAQAGIESGSLSLEVRPAAKTNPLRSGRATVELTRNGKKRSFECPGAIGDSESVADTDTGLIRVLTALQDDGSALTVRSTRPPDSQGHGEERSEAWLLDPDGAEAQQTEEALLSTQYDEDGDPMRAGLELWVGADDQVPLRGAGIRVCGTRLELDGWSLRAAFLAWTIEGVTGSGSYLIWNRG